MIDGRSLTLEAVEDVARARPGAAAPRLDAAAAERMRALYAAIERLIGSGQPVYGLTTGFGRLADVAVAREDRRALQHNLIRSHASGIGELLPPARSCSCASTLSPADTRGAAWSWSNGFWRCSAWESIRGCRCSDRWERAAIWHPSRMSP